MNIFEENKRKANNTPLAKFMDRMEAISKPLPPLTPEQIERMNNTQKEINAEILKAFINGND